MSTKGRILIVEDQKGFRQIYRDFFESQGYEIYTAEDGEIGWNMTREKAPNLILLDLGLPKLNGFEVLQKIKADPATREIKVIIFSVIGEQKEIDKAMSMGANGYTIKGFNTPREVFEKVETFFAQMREALTPVFPETARPQQA